MKNVIGKSPVNQLGYNFVDKAYLPAGADEYYLRNIQNKSGIAYRQLTAFEIEVLVRNRNTSDDWNKLLVSDNFTPELVKNCKFFGLVRIGKLTPLYLDFSDLKVPVGLYNSTIINSDFGDNVVIDNVNYLANYIIGNEVIVINVNELATSNHAKFGNGILKEGEEESVRIWMEISNENGGRSVLPFNGMQPGDAYMWSKYRDDKKLLEKFKLFTEKRFDKKRGYYGKIGDRTVIKNTSIIKDVWIGSDAYIKGANKLKNLTINSGIEGRTQIGEGCEMVNGIMSDGCRAFYGVKAVRFVMASHSQLKYGARLINSYLGNNATISCCEVLNSLIFPAHEQHHNNSFLTASTIMGQSNIAAGATIGSNHNSRGADGELVAGRGFWPGLCVSLKHNSKFASFNILAKGDYPAELNIPFPFALISNEVATDKLLIMPAYWTMYNMYALARNTWKYVDRDKRVERIQHIEYDYLAPDTINEIFEAIYLLEIYTGKAYCANQGKENLTQKQQQVIGKKLLETDELTVNELAITIPNIENSSRNVEILKPYNAYHAYKKMIVHYAANQLLFSVENSTQNSLVGCMDTLNEKYKRNQWTNIGGQLIPTKQLELLKKEIVQDKISSWQQVHQFYAHQTKEYQQQKLAHAMAAIIELENLKKADLTDSWLLNLFDRLLAIKTEITHNIYASRAKDYTNEFRKMTYANDAEMTAVLGDLNDNSFIILQQKELAAFKKKMKAIKAKFAQ